MDVAIFGAGVAGLMTAITLRARGHHCRIFERHRKSHEAGMGFILVPAAIECLQSFSVNLGAPFGGAALDHYLCRNSSGTILYRQTIPAGTRAIRRRDLMAALVSNLPQQNGLTFDAELDALEFTAHGATAAARLNSGVRVTADLFVGAEGIHSRARKALFPDWVARPDQVPEVVGLVRDPNTVRWAGANFNKFHSRSGGLAFGILPVDSDHLVWFLQADAQRYAPPNEDPEACRTFVNKLVGDWAEPIPHLLSTTDFSRVHLWRALDSDLVPRFHKGNLVLVGDAAHPLLPFTSQGVSSAVADAVTLAEFISGQGDLARALAEYSRQRRRQCAPYIARGRELLQHFLAPLEAKGMMLPIA